MCNILSIYRHQDWHEMHSMLGMLPAHRSFEWLEGCESFMDIA